MAEAPSLKRVLCEFEEQEPDTDMVVLKEVVADMEADAQEKPALRKYIDEAAFYLKDMMNYCKTATPQRRISLPYDSMSRFTGLITNYYDKWKWQDCEPRVILIGETGSGKSSLGNVLLEGRGPEPRFKVGDRIDSETKEFKEVQYHWLGDRSRKKVTVIDTPGTNDSKWEDPAIMEHFTEELNKMKYLTTFLLVFNSESSRFTKAHKSAINAFMGTFGIEMFSNLLVVFTRWATDEKSVKRRRATEQERSEEMTRKLREEFNIENDIPCYFLDCVDYQESDVPDEEVKDHKDTLEKMIEKIESLGPYKTIDKEKLFQKEQLIKNLLKQILRRSTEQPVTREEDKERAEGLERCISGCIEDMVREEDTMEETTRERNHTMREETRRTQRSIEAQTNIRNTRKKIEEEGSSWGSWFWGGAAGIVAAMLLVAFGIRIR